MSDVEAGAVLTLVVPLSLLVVVLALWAFAQRRTLRGRRSPAASRRDA